MARLYANENFPLPTVEELRRMGHDVLTIHESGKSGRAEPDDAVLAFALAEGRALLTLNRKHFIRSHKNKARHAGVIACTFDPNFKALAKRIHESVKSEEDFSGKLIRINRPEK